MNACRTRPPDRPASRGSARNADLADELVARAAEAWYPVALGEIERRLRELGYTLDHSLDCPGDARIMTGARAGHSYPCLTTGISEIDTGRSAFHVESRRDKRFEILQRLRFEPGLYAVVKGAIMDI